jgi:hypothetical protein
VHILSNQFGTLIVKLVFIPNPLARPRLLLREEPQSGVHSFFCFGYNPKSAIRNLKLELAYLGVKLPYLGLIPTSGGLDIEHLILDIGHSVLRPLFSCSPFYFPAKRHLFYCLS